ncbi:3-deoxy-manno-octulosonate cytidylyltransferase [Crocinitomix catalasitica]|uniref:3-deoxy-manno-octulosonate cytidylyltransferase n=1 Tax=Crocinitomix catalasitica TaxID=184607 RepID=UPI000485B6B8|nr:3-deoxy-manno-octulosonate cytidylyltransferase [Crocinitomix catalasitica]
MKVLGIIPSRYGSSRFPGKPLIDLMGKSMIQRVYEQAKKCSAFDTVLVATDHPEIEAHVLAFGGEVMMTSSDHNSGTERCGEVIQKYNDFDIIVNIQGDEPLIRPEQLNELVDLFSDSTVEIGTIVKKIAVESDVRNPNRIKVVLDANNNGIYFSRSPIPHIANTPHEDWLKKTDFFKHIGIYAWRKSTLNELLALPASDLEKLESLEQLRWLYNGYKIRTTLTTVETPNIDAPEDVERVLELLKKDNS